MTAPIDEAFAAKRSRGSFVVLMLIGVRVDTPSVWRYQTARADYWCIVFAIFLRRRQSNRNIIASSGDDITARNINKLIEASSFIGGSMTWYYYKHRGFM